MKEKYKSTIKEFGTLLIIIVFFTLCFFLFSCNTNKGYKNIPSSEKIGIDQRPGSAASVRKMTLEGHEYYLYSHTIIHSEACHCHLYKDSLYKIDTLYLPSIINK